MKTWIISDMHQQFDKLQVPKDIELCICAGDATNVKILAVNQNEAIDWCNWVRALPFDVIFVPGNHDMTFEGSLKFLDIPSNLITLRHESINYKGLRIFGSPYTPAFGKGWAFNINRSKIDKYWKEIPKGLDILITHGPPKSILDYTEYKRNGVTNVGDRSLLRHVIEKRPKYHIFGHLHDERDIYNAGVFNASSIPHTTFINASCVDLRHNWRNNGIVIDIEETFLQRIRRKYFTK